MKKFFCSSFPYLIVLVLLASCSGGGGSGSGGSVTGSGGGILSGILGSSGVSLGSSIFAKSYSSDDDSTIYSIQQTFDGGYIAAGNAYVADTGSYDMLALKLNGDGSIAWQKAYGGTDDEIANSVQQTADGGFIIAGETYSFGAGDNDMFLLKLNSDGSVAWQQTYGGSGSDSANAVQQTSDGGYIVAGYTSDGSSTGVWVLKLGADGSVVWQRAYSGAEDGVARAIQQTSDGGYIVAGEAYTSDAGSNMLVLKLDGGGNVAWQKEYKNAFYNSAGDVRQTTDGGYVVAGYTSNGSPDAWVLKLKDSGDIVWQKTYGGPDDDIAYSVRQTLEGGYIVAGSTGSFGSGGSDAWVLKLDGTGAVAWQKAYGGTDDDAAYAVRQSSDGGYIVAGYAASFGVGSADAWVFKLNSYGVAPLLGNDTNAVVTDTGAVASTALFTPYLTQIAPAGSAAEVTSTRFTINQQTS